MIDLHKESITRLHLDKDSLCEWINVSSKKPLKPGGSLEPFYASLPRVHFLKSLPIDSVLLEAGAGDGGLISFKNWIKPKRKDLTFWGTSLEHSGKTVEYDIFKIGMLGKDEISFPGMAHAFIACHLIEHLSAEFSLFHWMRERLVANSRVYLEWPSWHTQYLPSKNEVRLGEISAMTLNFFDDSTHVTPIRLKEIIRNASENGFRLISCGLIGSPYYSDQLIKEASANSTNKDAAEYLLTMALWQRTYFSSYAEFVKIG